MSAYVFFRLRVRTLLKFPKRVGEGLAREWTYWKPCTKTHIVAAPHRPTTIPRTTCNTKSGRTRVLGDSMPFLTSAG